MMLYADASFLAQMQAIKARTDLTTEGKEAAIRKLRPDLSKRSAIRAIDDGRYKFACYFSLKQHNTPTSMDELLKYNGLELFDLQNDPDEIHNLALNLKRNGELVMAMNEKLNALIAQELGVDDGSYLPQGDLGSWKAGHVVSE